jgi:glycosyltransferase involved in cell wall biosynthesis
VKIAWFSPLPPQRSGISDYSELILKYLRDLATVDLWVGGFSPQAHYYRDFRVINYDEQAHVLPLLKTYDAVVYHMGNNADFHAGIYEVFREYPGVVVLHDYVLHHLFYEYWLNVRKNSEGYLEEVGRQYGTAVRESARKGLQPFSKLLCERDDVFLYPLNRSIIKQARGVIVHSDFVKGLVENDAGGPVIRLHHPYDPASGLNGKSSRKELGLPEDNLLLASFGYMTLNKRIERVLEVIAQQTSLRERVCYLLIGEAAPGCDLPGSIARYNLTEQVRLLGYLSLDEALTYLNCADICINLRYPTMGETSGGLIRILALGKPAIVTNIGWYAELPDDCVIKIDSGEREEDSLANALLLLANDAELRDKLGAAALSYVRNNYSVQNFVKGLLDFLEQLTPGDEDGHYWRLLDRLTDIMIEFGADKSSLPVQISRQLTWAKS